MRYFLLSAALAAAPFSPALSWGQTGHRVTGAIAEQNLSGLARARIRTILGDESLAEASTWPDEMRSDPAEFWQKTANPWHYVTVPRGRTYREVGPPPEGDAASALQRFAATLRDPNASREQKQLALRFTVHIIGDLHQPLHAGNATDRGGNDVKVTFFGEETNLHSVWDSGIIDRQNLSFSEYEARLSRRIEPQEVVTWWQADPAVWIGESTKLRDGLYPSGTSLSWDYAYQHLPTVELRLQQAGIRIAAYLNQLFPA
ncbi:MAG: S1/P1 nuclease [Pseudomonadota bacterium]|nr:S1/P1 nuclease [Pseudomonadota bacterium]